ncbi:PepSY domain-containing protein [Pseudomonas putida]|uniref:PepSY domain-containing protein n=1 Tax=Pseudomonas putida TaxID=303 RepID=UPI003D973448
MKILATLFIVFTLFGLTANLGHTRDLRSDEARQLVEAGTIVPIEKVEAVAMARHPGSRIIETELKKRYGVYLYRIELSDPQGVEWELELDAADGLLRKDHQDN